MKPGYLKLYLSGELDRRIEQLYQILESCTLCPRACRKNRLTGETGYCRAGESLVVSAIHPHFGEEEPLVGTGGSGTVFLAGCNLGCVYCQNHDISHLGFGDPMSAEDLSLAMLRLQDMGCHNVNLVTPTHFAPQLVKSLKWAAAGGLRLPIVYNCGGYESAETIRLLEGIIDIYMPDIKYSDPASAQCFSDAPDYFDRCREAVREMHRQVGDLQLGAQDVAERGLLIRHLVLPNDVAGSQRVMQFIAEEISTDTYVNIMNQYRPLYRAAEYPRINRRPTHAEYGHVVTMAQSMGLHRGF